MKHSLSHMCKKSPKILEAFSFATCNYYACLLLPPPPAPPSAPPPAPPPAGDPPSYDSLFGRILDTHKASRNMADFLLRCVI